MAGHHRPRGFQRTDRIADQVQRELATLVQFSMKDPRLGLVTIQHVKVSRDLSWADVYFTQLGQGREDGIEAEAVLQNAAGWLRGQLAKQIRLRTIPRLRFHYDDIPEQADHLSRLIRNARADDEARGEGTVGDDEDEYPVPGPDRD